MQSKPSSAIKGLLPLFLVSNLIITALFVVAFALYSQGNADNNASAPTSTLSLTKLAERLDQPLAEALTIYEQDKVTQLLDMTTLLNDDYKYTLHRFNANNQAELVYSNNSKAIAPLAVNKHIKEQNTLHHLISSEGQIIGELIIKQTQSSVTPSNQHSPLNAYFVAFAALVVLFVLALMLNKYINNRLHKNTD